MIILRIRLKGTTVGTVHNQGELEPVIVPKHQSRGLSIEKLVISLYAKVTQAAVEWQKRK